MSGTATPVVLNTLPRPMSGDTAGYCLTHVSVTDVASTTNSTDLLATAISPILHASRLYINIQVATGSTVLLTAMFAGNTTKSIKLNGGSALTAGQFYRLGPVDVSSESGITYNIQLGTTTALDYLHVSESSGPASS